MKYIPKSISGAAAAGGYILLICYLVFSLFTSKDNSPHGDVVMSMVLLEIFTLPVSLVLSSDFTFLERFPDYPSTGIFVGILVCAVVLNASVIYLVVGYVSWGLRSLYTRLTKDLK